MSDILTTPLNEMTPMDPDVLACPHAFNERLRREAPVYPCPHTGITFVSDYDTITRIARDHETFSNRFSTAMPTGSLCRHSLSARCRRPSMPPSTSGSPREIYLLNCGRERAPRWATTLRCTASSFL